MPFPLKITASRPCHSTTKANSISCFVSCSFDAWEFDETHQADCVTFGLFAGRDFEQRNREKRTTPFDRMQQFSATQPKISEMIRPIIECEYAACWWVIHQHFSSASFSYQITKAAKKVIEMKCWDLSSLVDNDRTGHFASQLLPLVHSFIHSFVHSSSLPLLIIMVVTDAFHCSNNGTNGRIK